MNSAQPKVGLVVEGGAMRGVISMAFLTALQKYQLHDAFSQIFGSSAGAINAAYLLAGQAERGLALYLHEANTRQYFRKWRPWNILDLDAILKKITEGEQSLDCDKVRASQTKLIVPLTDAHTGACVEVPLEGSNERIFRILRATSSIPPYCNTPVTIDGKHFLDGGISEPIPIQTAINAGCTHILVLLTRPRNFTPRQLTWTERSLLRLAALPRRAQFREVFLHVRPQHYLSSRAIALRQSGNTNGVQIWSLTPPASLAKVYRFGNDPSVLRDVAQQCEEEASKVVAEHLSLLRGRGHTHEAQNSGGQVGKTERGVRKQVELFA
jgi:predicted patatin/cPLA2 family phospholipase